MNTPGSSWRRGAWETAAVLGRWWLAGLFLYMGMNKALHPFEFLNSVRQYDLVQSPFLLNSIAAALPWFEVFCGLLLLAGVAVRGAALILIGMLVPFTAAVLQRALAMHQASSIPFCAIRLDCGCGTGEVNICFKLLENSLLILVSGWLVAGGGRKLCLRHSLA